jgi:heterodisulfide reductase subunit C
MLAIRNIAIIEGYGAQGTIAQGVALIKDGRLVKISRLTEKRRANYGLQPTPSTGVEAIKTIAKATGFDKILERFKGGSK